MAEACIDGIRVFPIVFAVYILIEFIESKEASAHKLGKAFSSRFSPVFGSFIGIIPQCGFSVVATKFYQGGFIYLGTLISVYFATSDEALPIILSRAIVGDVSWLSFGLLVGIKLVYAMIIGFAINALIKAFKKSEPAFASSDFAEESFENDADGCCRHKISKKRENFNHFFLHPLIHTFKITLYIILVNVALNVLIDIVIGEERFIAFLTTSKWLQPVVCALVGLIPNCASSLVISELFCEGALTLGGALSGLTVNSGLGIAVLLKDKHHIKRNLGIVLLMFVLSLVLGYAVTAVTTIIT
ncbi:MAG: putative manganese transporter [Christensenellaceae bacterium]